MATYDFPDRLKTVLLDAWRECDVVFGKGRGVTLDVRVQWLGKVAPNMEKVYQLTLSYKVPEGLRPIPDDVSEITKSDVERFNWLAYRLRNSQHFANLLRGL